MNSENKQKVLYIVTGIVLFIAIFFIAVQYENKYVVNYSEIFVDLTTAGIALTAVLVTIYTFNINRKHLQKQQFESTFFNMMKQLEDIVSKLSIDDVKFTGRNVFDFLYNECFVQVTNSEIEEKIKCSEIQISRDKIYHRYLMTTGSKVDLEEIQFKGVKDVITELGIKGYEGCSAVYLLDHYFRYLYRIMRFVDEADFLESSSSDITVRYKYMGILRATLSPYELVFLFYNDLSKYGNEKVKPLIEKYSFFKSLRKDLLANTKYNYDLNIINDKFENDFDRFRTNKKGEKRKYYISAFEKDLTLFKDK